MFRTCLPADRYKKNYVNLVNPPYFWRINPWPRPDIENLMFGIEFVDKLIALI